MKLDETTLIKIQDYINTLDEKVGLKPETVEDVRKAIDKHRTELKNLRLVAVGGLDFPLLSIHDFAWRSEQFCSCSFVMIMRDSETGVAYCSECKKEVNEQN